MTDWSEAKIEQLSESTATDVDEAGAAWRTDSLPEAVNLLDAETQEAGE